MSPLLPVNLTDVSIEGPPRIEPGVYLLESTKITIVPPKADKAGAIDVIFREANAEEDDKRVVQKRFTFSENALPYFKRWLVAAGKPELAESEDIDSEDLLHLVAKASVGSEDVTENEETRTFARINRFIITDDQKAE